MNFENSISLNFPAIMLEILETLKRFKSFIIRFIFPKFHETLQPDTRKTAVGKSKQEQHHLYFSNQAFKTSLVCF